MPPAPPAKGLAWTLCARVSAAVLVVACAVAASSATAGTVAYWQLDDATISNPGPGDSVTPGAAVQLLDAVGTHDLAVRLDPIDVGDVIASTVEGVPTLQNADASAGFAGDAADNFGSALFSGVVPGRVRLQTSGATTAFSMSGRSWTFETWLQRDGDVAPTGFGQILAGTRDAPNFGGWNLHLRGGLTLAATFTEAGGATGDDTFSIETSTTIGAGLGNWNHVALTWQDGVGTFGTGFAELYLNGALVDSRSAGAGFSAATADANDFDGFLLGGRSTVDSGWDGRIDEARFSDAVLAPSGLLNFVEPDPGPPEVPEPSALALALTLLGLASIRARFAR